MKEEKKEEESPHGPPEAKLGWGRGENGVASMAL